MFMDYWITFKDYTFIIFRFIVFQIEQFFLTTDITEIVPTNYGRVEGIKRITCWRKPYFCFYKIPFAKPPIGKLRFSEPIPPESWNGILDCTAEGSVPPQNHFIFKYPQGSEDCLYLNIFTKTVEPTSPLPVMVYIPGGRFQEGGARRQVYSPDYLMEEDVIVVTFSYRLGALGFLSLKDPTVCVPGNAGLKDQQMALKWIKENIAHFGGDVKNITVFGESAGAVSVHFQMVSEKSQGLFQKAILMSGNVLTNSAQQHVDDGALRLVKKLGYSGDMQDKNILEFLRKIHWKSIVKAQTQLLTQEDERKRIIFPFGPTVEPYESEHSMILQDPKILMRTAWSNEIPIIIGGTSFEGLVVYTQTKNNPAIINDLKTCQDLLPLDLKLNTESSLAKEFGLKLKETYFGGKDPKFPTNFMDYLQLISHKFYWHGLNRTVLSRLAYSSANTFLYRFDFDSPTFNHLRFLLCGSKMRGVCHGDDISYVFYNGLASTPRPSGTEYNVIKQFTGALANFARTGDPNHTKLPENIWNPLERNDGSNGDLNLKCLNFSNVVAYVDLPERNQLSIWNSFYQQNEKLF